MKNKFEKIFKQLADFRALAGYDGWMIGACVYAQRETGKQDCKSGIVRKTSSFAVMRNQIEEDGIVYQLELHVVKPDVQGAVTSKQAGMEKNMAMDEEKSKLEEQRIYLHHSVGTEETADTGGEGVFTFTHLDIIQFVDAVGDTNSIHRTVHAVVPGLLMVERMLDMWMRKQPETKTDIESQAEMKNETQAGAQAGVQTETENEMQTDMQNSREFICRFRFEKPVFVDEKLQVEARTERGKQIYDCKREDREIVWNMRIL